MDLQLDYWTNADPNPNSGGEQPDGSVSKTDGGSGSKMQQKMAVGSMIVPTSDRTSLIGGLSSNDNSDVTVASFKNSIKSSMWFMQIQRLPDQVAMHPHNNAMPTFTMQYRLKEKKQKG